MIQDYFRYSLNNMSKRRLRSWLTMFGIFIGIASVVALMGLGSGLEEAILGEFSALGTDKIIVQVTGSFGPPGSSSIAVLTIDDYDAVEDIPGMKVVTRRILKATSFEFDDIVAFPFAVSMPEGDRARDLVVEVNSMEFAKGRNLKEDDKRKVVISDGLANNDQYSRPVDTGDTVLINDNQYEVVGILEKSGAAGQSLLVIMNEDVMRDDFNLGDFVSMIIFQVQDIDDIDRLSDTIERKLRRHRGLDEGDEDFDVQTPQQFIETFKEIFGIVQGIVIGIAGISLLVGAIGIMNTMYTSVLERTKEIGIMKAIGARNKDVLLIFMIESGFMGLVGGFIGMLFGVGLGYIVEIGSKIAMGQSLIQASFSPGLIFGILAFSFIIGVISGYFPARQASSLKPVDALRG